MFRGHRESSEATARCGFCGSGHMGRAQPLRGLCVHGPRQRAEVRRGLSLSRSPQGMRGSRLFGRNMHRPLDVPL